MTIRVSSNQLRVVWGKCHISYVDILQAKAIISLFFQIQKFEWLVGDADVQCVCTRNNSDVVHVDWKRAESAFEQKYCIDGHSSTIQAIW